MGFIAPNLIVKSMWEQKSPFDLFVFNDDRVGLDGDNNFNKQKRKTYTY